MTTIVDRRSFSRHLSGDQIARLLRHRHWKSMTNGATARFVAENLPGWTWNRATDVLRAARVVRNGRYCGQVEMIHFDDSEHWLVEWEDGNVTASAAMSAAAVPVTSGVER